MTASQLELRARERLGTSLRGKYRLDRVIGVGGMAVVYAATHRNQKRVAVKMLHADVSLREDIRTRFLREGYVANTVDHPGAVSVLDDDLAEDGAAFLVMELLAGYTVDDLAEGSGQLPAEIVLGVAYQLLDVLAKAHEKTIIHRDVKPANVFVTGDGTVKLLDFGIARLHDVTAQDATSTGIFLGTPAFMAPEQALAKAREIDAQTDVWSVGAAMFTLLSGQLVHEAENASQLVIYAATRPARSLASVAPAIDARVVAIVDRALAFEKSQRWPTAGAMRDAVREAHRALLGAPPGKDALAQLVAKRDAALEAAPPPPETVRMNATAAAETPATPAPTLSDREPAPIAERSSTGTMAATTTSPVYATPQWPGGGATGGAPLVPQRQGPAQQPGRALLGVALAIAAVVLLGVTALVVPRVLKKREPPVAIAEGDLPTMPSPLASTSASASASATASTLPTPTPTPSAAVAETTDAEPAASALAELVTPASASAAKPRPPAATASAPAAPPAAPKQSTADAARALLRRGDPQGAKALLFPKVSSGRGTAEDVDLLQGICMKISDIACVELCLRQDKRR